MAPVVPYIAMAASVASGLAQYRSKQAQAQQVHQQLVLIHLVKLTILLQLIQHLLIQQDQIHLLIITQLGMLSAQRHQVPHQLLLPKVTGSFKHQMAMAKMSEFHQQRLMPLMILLSNFQLMLKVVVLLVVLVFFPKMNLLFMDILNLHSMVVVGQQAHIVISLTEISLQQVLLMPRMEILMILVIELE